MLSLPLSKSRKAPHSPPPAQKSPIQCFSRRTVAQSHVVPRRRSSDSLRAAWLVPCTTLGGTRVMSLCISAAEELWPLFWGRKSFAKPHNGTIHMYTFYTKPVYFKHQFLSYRWQIAGRTGSTAAPLPEAIPILRLRVAPAPATGSRAHFGAPGDIRAAAASPLPPRADRQAAPSKNAVCGGHAGARGSGPWGGQEAGVSLRGCSEEVEKLREHSAGEVYRMACLPGSHPPIHPPPRLGSNEMPPSREYAPPGFTHISHIRKQ